MDRRVARASLYLLLLLAHAPAARAHDPGLSSITLLQLPGGGRYSLLVNDADLPDGRRANHEACAHGVLQLAQAGEPLAIEHARCRQHDPKHTAFEGDFAIAGAGPLRVELLLLRELPRGHRSYLRVIDPSGQVIAQRVLGQDEAGIELVAQARARPPADFFVLGVEHIATGFDHLLFLALALLGVASWRRMALIVSGFTAAHSLTLALATLDWVRLPAQWVESAIAASIVFVALRHCTGRLAHGERLATVFGFGLVHGLGFASALSELGVEGSPARVLGPLLLFNLGVEAGQLAFGALLLPLLIYLQRAQGYGPGAARALSGAAAALGMVWFIERAFWP